MGKLTNLNPAKALTEADMPGSMATDTEVDTKVSTAITAHLVGNPHPQYLMNDQGLQLKMVVFKGTTSASIGDIDFPHGLDSKKILSITGIIAATPEGEGGFPPAFIASSFGGLSTWHLFFTANRVFIVTGSSRQNCINRRFTVTIIYEV